MSWWVRLKAGRCNHPLKTEDFIALLDQLEKGRRQGCAWLLA